MPKAFNSSGIRISSVFDFTDYKEFLSAKLREQRGVGKDLSTFIRIQPSYLSQILHGKVHLSLEQAELVTRYFEMQPLDVEYFILLVSEARAGSENLKKLFRTQIERLKRRSQNLQTKFPKAPPMNAEIQSEYFSTWIYAAVHLATQIPKLRSSQDLARFLSLAPTEIERALRFLERSGLIERSDKGEWKRNHSVFHLGLESPWIRNHHQSWRIKAIDQILRSRNMENLHYSSVITSDAETINTMRAELIQTIERIKGMNLKAGDTHLHSIGIDFFSLGQ